MVVKHKEDQELYGLIYTELDRTFSGRNRLLIWGDLRKVELYRERYALKGNVRIYKTKTWLAKRIEHYKGIHMDELNMLYLKK